MNIVEITVRRGWPAAPFFAEIGLESTRPLSSLSDDNTSSPDTKMELRPRRKVLILAVQQNEKVVLVWEASFSRPGLLMMTTNSHPHHQMRWLLGYDGKRWCGG